MQNKTWKKERDLLSEAYASLSETTHSPENSCKDDEYYCKVDKVCKPKEDKNVKEEDFDKELGIHADRPAGDDHLEDLGEPDVLDVAREPAEVQAEIDSLKSLLLNPPADKIEEYAEGGKLGDYIDMLKSKLDAAEKVKGLLNPSVDD